MEGSQYVHIQVNPHHINLNFHNLIPVLLHLLPQPHHPLPPLHHQLLYQMYHHLLPLLLPPKCHVIVM